MLHRLKETELCRCTLSTSPWRYPTCGSRCDVQQALHWSSGRGRGIPFLCQRRTILRQPLLCVTGLPIQGSFPPERMRKPFSRGQFGRCCWRFPATITRSTRLLVVGTVRTSVKSRAHCVEGIRTNPHLEVLHQVNSAILSQCNDRVAFHVTAALTFDHFKMLEPFLLTGLTFWLNKIFWIASAFHFTFCSIW